MKRLFLLVAIAVLFTSCNKDGFIAEKPEAGNITDQVIIRAGVDNPEARSSVAYGSPIGAGEDFKWLTGDQISVFYPDGNNYVTSRFTLQSIDPDNDNKANFTGTLNSGTYAVLYGFSPYKLFNNSYNLGLEIPDIQVQNGKSADHIGKYDFMVAKEENVNHDDIDFSFKHLNPMLRFICNNTTSTDYRLSNIIIHYKESRFYKNGTLDLLALNYSEYDSDETYKTLSLFVKDGPDEGIALSAGESLNSYMMTLPTEELSATDKLIISANYTNAAGSNLYAVDMELSATDNLPAFAGGMRYCFTLDFQNGQLLWEGDGTEISPYKISSAQELKHLADRVNSGYSFLDKHFKLMNDITLDFCERVIPVIRHPKRFIIFKYIYSFA